MVVFFTFIKILKVSKGQLNRLSKCARKAKTKLTIP